MKEEYGFTVHPFEMGTPKEAAVKVLEEASEAYNAWDVYYDSIAPDYFDRECFADDIANCIQACCNLAARHNIDLESAMRRCEQRNRNRGRYEVQP